MTTLGEAVATRQAFGRCRSVQAQIEADFAVVTAVVTAEPGLRLREVADRIRGRVSWRDPLAALQRHAMTASGRMQKARLRLEWEGKTARLWPREVSR